MNDKTYIPHLKSMNINRKVKEWASFFRDLGMIAGVPTLLYFVFQVQGIQEKSFEAQLTALKIENETLKEHQYDKTNAVIQAQKALAENELELIQRNIQMVGDSPPDLRRFNKMMCLNIGNASKR